MFTNTKCSTCNNQFIPDDVYKGILKRAKLPLMCHGCYGAHLASESIKRNFEKLDQSLLNADTIYKKETLYYTNSCDELYDLMEPFDEKTVEIIVRVVEDDIDHVEEIAEEFEIDVEQVEKDFSEIITNSIVKDRDDKEELAIKMLRAKYTSMKEDTQE